MSRKELYSRLTTNIYEDELLTISAHCAKGISEDDLTELYTGKR